MPLKHRLNSWIQRQRFLPSPLGVFVNRDFIIRRGLAREVERFAMSCKGSVLDFGCGQQPYRELFEVQKYVGVDMAVSGHSSDKKHADVYLDSCALPFSDEAFEAALSTEVFQYVPDIPAALGEISRVLKPGAPLLITYPFAYVETEMPYDLARYTSVGLDRYLEKAQFDVERVVKMPSYVETLTQLFTLFLSRTVLPWKRNSSRLISTALVLAPINLLGIALGRVLPNDTSYFHNCVIVARKRKPSARAEQITPSADS